MFDQSESRRKRAIASVDRVTTSMVDSVNLGVARVFSNQKKIERHAVLLQNQTERFSKQTSQWLQLIEGFNQALKVPPKSFIRAHLATKAIKNCNVHKIE